MRIGISAAFQQHHWHIQGVCRSENGAHIAGILNSIQQEHTGLRCKSVFLRQPAQKQRPLGTLHGRDGCHHITRNPDKEELVDKEPIQNPGEHSGEAVSTE